ncbi:MAG: nickel pincer cofactor biosynthesis protein LarC [Oscillospiraceae bacterium]|nr:nickel pincer cofactor biosynthesis protein LarC [Oscillospiraceae bacterium]
MRTLYLECGMGAAGDMLTAALLELLPDQEAFIQKMNRIGLSDTKVQAESVMQSGILGSQVSVLIHGEEEHSHDVHTHHHEHHHHEGEHHHEHHHHEDEHHHASLASVFQQIQDLQVSEQVKRDTMNVYTLIAEAEGKVHGKSVSEIHFHEVGTKDAIADIAAVCILMEMLAPEQVIVSPVHVGSGYVKCAHGILPVPAPATAILLQDVPIYSGDIDGELCTPTGAALLKYFANAFSSMPVMRVMKTGYGFGKKAFPKLNCIRAFLGETASEKEIIAELVCNLDDMTGEEIGFAQQILMENGALDVFTTPVTMKKGRPGVLLTVLCHEEKKEQMLELIFLHTSTIGIREHACRRTVQFRSEKTVHSPLGDVRVKFSEGYGTVHTKLEYEDLATIARQNQMSLHAVKMQVEKDVTENL